MKKIFLLILLVSFIPNSLVTGQVKNGKQPKVNLILDTDLGPDFDDVGAMTLMHALADSGQVKILATLSSNHNQWVVPCIEVLNTYFGRPEIPLGAPKSKGGANMTSDHKNKWTQFLPAHYPAKIKSTDEAPDAVQVYRKVLSQAKDKSVTICTVGFFTNLRDLLQSGPDKYSKLNGKALVARKVAKLVSMAAGFPSGREFNVFIDSTASYQAIPEWPTEIIFSGFEIGNKILTGTKVIKMNVQNSPVKDVYSMCLKENDFGGRPSWDQTAVLVAIKGYKSYFNVERGECIVAKDGSNSWKKKADGKHLRLLPGMQKDELASIIENYMMHQPKR